MTTNTHPHQGQPVLFAGTAVAQAAAAMIMLHGRGANAEDILGLTHELDITNIACYAPQAANYAWYPQRFVAPEAQNEPYLSSALQVVGDLVAQIEAAGIGAEKIMLLGFSQGACLALEYVARNPRRYGAAIALSGALIERGDQPREYTGSLAGTPCFLGCSDVDFHIPRERVERSAAILQTLGGEVDLRLYRGMGHTVNLDEIGAIKELISRTIRS
jgi:phospholipase/carboxylesterase